MGIKRGRGLHRPERLREVCLDLIPIEQLIVPMFRVLKIDGRILTTFYSPYLAHDCT